MSSSADRAQHLTQKLADYILLYQKCSDKVRPYGRVQTDVIYDEAHKEWQSDPSNPLVEPPPGDRAKIDAHFATCDSICASKPQNTHDIYKISFACWAGMQVIQSQELANMPDKGRIVATANKLAVKMYVEQNPDAATLLPEPPNSTLPPHLQSAFFPTSTVPAVVIGPYHIGTTFSFLDKTSGEIMECTIQDYGTSELRGDWVEVVYNNRELRISPGEVNDMLANRVA